jgi:hypothetical protein
MSYVASYDLATSWFSFRVTRHPMTWRALCNSPYHGDGPEARRDDACGTTLTREKSSRAANYSETRFRVYLMRRHHALALTHVRQRHSER